MLPVAEMLAEPVILISATVTEVTEPSVAPIAVTRFWTAIEPGGAVTKASAMITPAEAVPLIAALTPPVMVEDV